MAEEKTSVTNSATSRRIQKKKTTNPRSSLSKGSNSPKVILMEGEADESVPNIERATGMHGFAIVMPADQKDGWLLDMLWRITMAYAAMPSLLYSRAKVRKMVEAVMSRELRSVDVDKPKRTRVSKRNRAG
jgi:hypothetical protein